MIEIRGSFGRVLYTSNKETIRDAVEEAVANGVSLTSAILDCADFVGANLKGAVLVSASLAGADLRDVDLEGANLINACLQDANLEGANLSGVSLWGADLRGVRLRGSNVVDANNADYVFAVTSICSEGDIIGYKNTSQGVVKLRIPEHAARSNATGRKCRASEAIVLETPNHEPATSRHDSSFVYREGETVRPAEPFDPDRWNECGAGIHFFLTRIEAERY